MSAPAERVAGAHTKLIDAERIEVLEYNRLGLDVLRNDRERREMIVGAGRPRFEALKIDFAACLPR